MYKDSKWAKDILSLQDQNGLWGYFHTYNDYISAYSHIFKQKLQGGLK